MSARKITANFHDGPATRTSEAAYTHASRRQGSSTVRFHTSERAARSAAGRFGEVVRTDFSAPASDAPASATWRVRYSDGTTHDVRTDVPPEAVQMGREAHPDKTVTGASRIA